jgi:hypothetical protein
MVTARRLRRALATASPESFRGSRPTGSDGFTGYVVDTIQCSCSTCRSSIRQTFGNASSSRFRSATTFGSEEMNTTSSSDIVAEVPAYAALRRQIHDALLVQHPEWIQRNGDCPKCDDYDRRLAELLSLSRAMQRTHAYTSSSCD